MLSGELQRKPTENNINMKGTNDYLDRMNSNLATTEAIFDWACFIAELETNENDMIAIYVQRCPFLITEQADEKGFTLLHHAVLKCIPGKVLKLITLAKELQGATDHAIKKWVNSRTNTDQFTPLHLASFKGNMDAVHTLMAHWADPNAENFYGLNMLHVAAQGDAAPSLFYFKQKDVDINKKDKRGSTPLHWACYSNSEIALSYLLAWGP